MSKLSANTSTTVNTSLLRRLVKELDESLKLAEALEVSYASAPDNKQIVEEYVVELSKAAGLASQVAKEGTYLTADVNAVLLKTCSLQVMPSVKSDDMKDMLDLLGFSGKPTGPSSDGSKN